MNDLVKDFFKDFDPVFKVLLLLMPFALAGALIGAASSYYHKELDVEIQKHKAEEAKWKAVEKGRP